MNHHTQKTLDRTHHSHHTAPVADTKATGFGSPIAKADAPLKRFLRLSADFLRLTHGTPMGEPCGEPTGSPAPFGSGLPTRTDSPTRLEAGAKFSTLPKEFSHV